MSARSIPLFGDLSQIFFSEEQCIENLFQCNILNRVISCNLCNGAVRRYRKVFQCTRASCRKAISIFVGSFFSKNRLRCNEIMHLAYLWLTGCTSETMLHHVGHSTATISAYRQYFRQLVAEMVDSDDMIIGGQGIIVQVDETKIGKRKYNRGRRVDGSWVVVGVEITTERRVFAEVVEDRSEETITRVLCKHIAEGSVIWTDMWRGYASLSTRFNIEHQTVNHSLWFKDPESGVNTNTVEGTNYAIKRNIPLRNRTATSIPTHLLEFIWRRLHKDNLWDSFIACLREVAYQS
jgi:transposase-like protein